jgi:hypothetical protein
MHPHPEGRIYIWWMDMPVSAGGEAIVWGEHSLNEQRYFNIVCGAFGQNPDQFRNFIADGILPEDRAERCPGEWARIDSSWTTLLEDYSASLGRGTVSARRSRRGSATRRRGR